MVTFYQRFKRSILPVPGRTVTWPGKCFDAARPNETFRQIIIKKIVNRINRDIDTQNGGSVAD